MYSKYNNEKSVGAERLIRTQKKQIFKHMKIASKNVYFERIQ